MIDNLPGNLIGAAIPANITQRMKLGGDSRDRLRGSEVPRKSGRQQVKHTVEIIDVSSSITKHTRVTPAITMNSLDPSIPAGSSFRGFESPSGALGLSVDAANVSSDWPGVFKVVVEEYADR